MAGSKIPTQPDDIVKSLHLDPGHKKFICCPQCFFLIPWPKHDDTQVPQCIRHWLPYQLDPPCTSQVGYFAKKMSSPFSTFKATKSYSHHCLKSWIAHFLLRSDIEKKLSQASFHQPPADAMHNIWDGTVWRNFWGKNETDPFNSINGNLSFSI